MRKIMLLTVLLCLVVFAVPSNAGTKDVNVANEPTVHVGTMPDVNIGNEPTVNLGNTANVNVLNETLQVELSNGGDSERIPFQADGGGTIPENHLFASTSFRVERPYRLVIEHLVVWAELPNSQVFERFELNTNDGANYAEHFFPLFKFNSGVVDYYTSVQNVRFYADGGTDVGVVIRRNGTTGFGEYHFSVTGYLEPWTIPPPL